MLILAGVYATYSKWVNIEIQLAKEMDEKLLLSSHGHLKRHPKL
ncbi:MAG: hypothetical protein ACLVJ4_00360 [Mediterraneibacter sp.]